MHNSRVLCAQPSRVDESSCDDTFSWLADFLPSEPLDDDEYFGQRLTAEILPACTRLRRLALDFTGCHYVTARGLPAQFSLLTRLRSLRLLAYEVTALPPVMSRMASLTELVILNQAGSFSYRTGDPGPPQGIEMPAGLFNAMPALEDVQLRGNFRRVQSDDMVAAAHLDVDEPV